MTKEQFADLAKHRYGSDKPMSGAQLDKQFYTNIPPVPREKWPALGPSILVNTGPELQPRERDLKKCADCGGTDLRVTKVSSVGTKTYGPCKHGVQ